MKKDDSDQLPTREETGPKFKITPKKIALISKRFNYSDGRGSKGFSSFSEHLRTITQICEESACDTILYCLYTFDRKKNNRLNKNLMFGNTKKIKNVIIEHWDSSDKAFPWRVEVWNKEKRIPFIHFQRFGKSQEPKDRKIKFLDDFESRSHGETHIMICGESNIINTKRKGPPLYIDNYNFLENLNNKGIKFILNPIHDFTRRYEMKKKRAILSRGGRYLISVWNHGKPRESKVPWTVYYDGDEITSRVKQIQPNPIPSREDIQIGLLSIK